MSNPSPFSVSITLTEGSSSLLCRADVEGSTMRVFGFSLFQKKDGSGFFVSEPSRKVGEKWVPVIEFKNKAQREEVHAAIVMAYRKALESPNCTKEPATGPAF